MDSSPKFPSAKLRVTKTSGDAELLLRKAIRSLRRNKATAGDVEQFVLEATKGDYIDFIRVCKQWMTVC